MSRTQHDRVHADDTVTFGALVGVDRMRRIAPFAVTAVASLLWAVPLTTWEHPWLAVVGSVGAAAATLTAAALPWKRLPRSAQLLPPELFVASMLLLLAAARSGDTSPYLTLMVLPLAWLAIYEPRRALWATAVLTGPALWFLMSTDTAVRSTSPTVSIVVFVICAAGVGTALNSLVTYDRKLAADVRVDQAIIERDALTLDALPEQVSRYRLDDHAIVYHNATWAGEHGVGAGGAVGHSLDEYLSDDEKEGLRYQLLLLGPETPIREDPAQRAAPGTQGRWFQWIDRFLPAGKDGIDADGDEILSIGRDVTDRHLAEEALAASEARYRDLADRSADVVWHFVLEPEPHFDYMSPSVESILGYSPSYFLEDFDRMLEILDNAGTTAIARAIKGERILDRFDFRLRHANGSIVIGETRTTPIRGGLQGVSRDVTELRTLQANVEALALRDSLTGLANRRLFNELLESAVTRTERSGRELAVAFLDLDGFKAINDRHGHKAGDHVLRETAHRLLANVRGADTVARLGGDEFVFVFEPDDQESSEIIERIARVLAEPIHLSPDMSVSCPASIGVADTASVGYDAEALLAAADAAMYVMKRTRQNGRASV
jgi:diguanylate cyclase (GGDEF)-like protein/PAS domain S-box-containing protein